MEIECKNRGCRKNIYQDIYQVGNVIEHNGKFLFGVIPNKSWRVCKIFPCRFKQWMDGRQ